MRGPHNHIYVRQPWFVLQQVLELWAACNSLEYRYKLYCSHLLDYAIDNYICDMQYNCNKVFYAVEMYLICHMDMIDHVMLWCNSKCSMTLIILYSNASIEHYYNKPRLIRCSIVGLKCVTGMITVSTQKQPQLISSDLTETWLRPSIMSLIVIYVYMPSGLL